MKYHLLDQYRDAESFIHQLDPRAKFLATLALVSAIVLTPRDGWLAYGLFLTLNLILLLLSRVPPFYVLKRSFVIFPFVLMVAVFMPFRGGTEVFGASIGSWHIGLSREGLILTASVFCKAWLSVVSLILITATTNVSDLLKGLERLKMPAIMVMLMSFMYRYLFVISDEAERLSLARNSRSFGGGIRLHVRTLGYMAGALFLRSYERGERIYGAMLSRGFDGHGRSLNQLSMRLTDVFYMTIITAASLLIAVLPLLLRNLSG
jgi:cobalt/nickel transport system permease protein